MRYNYQSEELTTVREFDYKLLKSPDFIVWNDKQTIAFMATKDETLMVNLINDREEDIDDYLMI